MPRVSLVLLVTSIVSFSCGGLTVARGRLGNVPYKWVLFLSSDIVSVPNEASLGCSYKLLDAVRRDGSFSNVLRDAFLVASRSFYRKEWCFDPTSVKAARFACFRDLLCLSFSFFVQFSVLSSLGSVYREAPVIFVLRFIPLLFGGLSVGSASPSWMASPGGEAATSTLFSGSVIYSL